MEWHDLSLDPATLTATLAGAPLSLTRRESGILHALMERPGMIVPKTRLEEVLYGWQEEIGSNAVEVHVHHLRGKLGPGVVETVRGVGYRLKGQQQ